MKKYLVLLAVLLSISVVNAQPYVQISFDQVPNPVISGNDATIVFKILNLGPSYIEKLKIQFMNSGSPIELSSYLPENIGSLSVGNTIEYEVKVHVPASLSTGFYTLSFKISSCDSSTCRDYVVQPILQVVSPGSPKIQLEPNEIPLNFTGNVKLSIKNYGSKISDLTIEINSPALEILGSSNRINIPIMKPNGTRVINLNVSVNPSIQPGIYPVYVSGCYFDALGTKHYLNSTLNLKIFGNSIFIISATSESKLTENGGYIEIKISNAGNEKAKFLTLYLKSDSLKIEPSTIYIGNLDSDDYDSEKIFVRPFTNKTGIYNISLTLQYQDTFGKTKYYTTEIPVEITETTKTNKSYEIVLAFCILIVTLGLIVYKRRKK